MVPFVAFTTLEPRMQRAMFVLVPRDTRSRQIATDQPVTHEAIGQVRSLAARGIADDVLIQPVYEAGTNGVCPAQSRILCWLEISGRRDEWLRCFIQGFLWVAVLDGSS
jgi:hypothetical protein